jgi:hypothetical protein
MKTTLRTVLSILTFVALANQLFAQGTVVFQNNVPGVLRSHVYFHPTIAFDRQATGNGPNDLPPGTHDWSGYVALSGSSYLAALIAVPGQQDPLSSRDARFGSAIASFGTGTEAGFFQGSICQLPGVPKDSALATIRVFAWDNSSGKYSDPASALGAWMTGQSLAAGFSSPFTVNNIGGDLNAAPNLTGLESFNIIYPVPEPTATALLALGTAAWGWRRWPRRN